MKEKNPLNTKTPSTNLKRNLIITRIEADLDLQKPKRTGESNFARSPDITLTMRNIELETDGAFRKAASLR
jgi:hypothetical protein